MRIRLIALAIVLTIASLLLGGYWARERRAAARRLGTWQEQKEEETARLRLEGEVFLSGQPISLREFAELIRQASGLAVEVDEKSITANGFSPGLAMNQVPESRLPIESALRLVLEPRGLCADLRGGTLVITTPANSTDRNELRTVVYPLPQPEPAGMDERDWTDLITTNIEPGTWDITGGGPGHVEAVPGALVVVQTAENQRRVRALINTIRDLDDSSPQIVQVPPRNPGSTEARISQELDRPTVLEFVETPLGDAIQYLREMHRIPIILLPQKLNDAGLSTDIPVTKNLNGISLRSALRLLLRDLDVTFLIRDEALVITTPEDAEMHLRDMVYPVHDLVEPTDGSDLESLVHLIEECVAHHAWSFLGGPGTLHGIGDGWLLVQQTDDVHEQVFQLLAQLRLVLSGDDNPRSLTLRQQSGAELKVRQALERTIQLEFRDTPLKDAVSFVQEVLNIPMALSGTKLEEAGISVDTPVTLQAPAGRATFLLQLLLEPLDLTFLVRDEVLQITTLEDSETELIRRVYDVRALSSVPFSIDLPSIISAVLHPRSWDDLGGPGAIEDFRGILVVSQTESVHRDVERLLATLEEQFVQSQLNAAEQPKIVPIAVNPHRAHIEGLLDRPVSVTFEDIPLDQALLQLASDHGLPMVVDTKGLEEAGVSTETLVTLATEQRPLRHTLLLLLEPLRLGWFIRENLLFVTSEERIARSPEVRLYWVADLAMSHPEKSDGLRQAMYTAMPTPWPGYPLLNGTIDFSIEIVTADWFGVAASQPLHQRLEEWLIEQRTGQAPQSALDRKALDAESERDRQEADRRMFESIGDPFVPATGGHAAAQPD